MGKEIYSFIFFLQISFSLGLGGGLRPRTCSLIIRGRPLESITGLSDRSVASSRSTLDGGNKIENFGTPAALKLTSHFPLFLFFSLLLSYLEKRNLV